MIEQQLKQIKGKLYQYGLCPKCLVWIPWKEFNPTTEDHPGCEKYLKTREIRKSAERIALGKVNK